MRKLAEHGTDEDTHQAAIDGKMLSGISAGAILPFARGHSDKSAKSAIVDLDIIDGLGIVPAVVGVHINKQLADGTTRLDDLLTRYSNETLPGLALENGAGVLSWRGEHSIVRSAEGANVLVVSMIGDIASSRVVEDDADITEVMRSIYAA
jgi:peptidase E